MKEQDQLTAHQQWRGTLRGHRSPAKPGRRRLQTHQSSPSTKPSTETRVLRLDFGASKRVSTGYLKVTSRHSIFPPLLFFEISFSYNRQDSVNHRFIVCWFSLLNATIWNDINLPTPLVSVEAIPSSWHSLGTSGYDPLVDTLYCISRSRISSSFFIFLSLLRSIKTFTTTMWFNVITPCSMGQQSAMSRPRRLARQIAVRHAWLGPAKGLAASGESSRAEEVAEIDLDLLLV